MELLIRKQTLKEYDLMKCKENVEELLTEYIRSKYAFDTIKNQGQDYYDSSTISNYEYKPEMLSINYTDRVGNQACFKVQNEMEAEKLKKDLEKLYPKFTDQEYDFFTMVLLNKCPQKDVEDKYKVTKGGIEPAKQSCILKTALHFNIAVKYDTKK